MSSASALQITQTNAAAPLSAQLIQESSVTELVFTRHSPGDNQMLLPMLAHFSRNSDRWITWIVSSPVNARELVDYGVDTEKLRIIYSHSAADSRWIAWEALNNGTSHTVIATPGHLNNDELGFFKQASENGSSHGLFIHYRQ